MAAEQALAFPISEWLSDPSNRRKVAMCGAAVIAVLGLAASCKENDSRGGGSTIDTDGTRGSGYRPGGHDWKPMPWEQAGTGTYGLGPLILELPIEPPDITQDI